MKGHRTFSERAQLFSQLALMEHAGLPAATALGTLRLGRSFASSATAMQRLLVKGVDLASAGQRSGMFTPFETDLVRAACQGGSPEPTFTRLALDYERRAAHRASVRSKLFLPCALFVLALFIGPLPDLVAGTLGLAGYLMRCFVPIAAVALLIWLYSTQPARRARAALVSHLPVFGSMHERRSIRDLFQNLALLLEAGLPVAAAFPVALKTVPDLTIAARFAPIGSLTARATALTAALESVKFVDQADAIGFVRTGEGSGTLPAMLQRFADRESDTVNRFDAIVAEWTPRLVYGAVAAWMAWSVIHDTLALQKMPDDL